MAIEYRRVRQYLFTLFPAALLRLGVIPTPGVPGEAIPVGYTEIPQRWPGVVGAINGPMASYGANDSHSYDTWRTSRLDSAYFDQFNGVDVPPRRPGMGLTVGIKDNGAHALEPYAARGWSKDGLTAVAVQLPFGMVTSGRVGEGLDRGNLTERTLRALLGITRDGRLMFGGGGGPCADCAAAAVEAGCLVAGYLDGGCSYNQEYAADQLHGTRCDRRTPSRILIAPDGTAPALVQLVAPPCNTNTCRRLDHAPIPGAPRPQPQPQPTPAQLQQLQAPQGSPLAPWIAGGVLLAGGAGLAWWIVQHERKLAALEQARAASGAAGLRGSGLPPPGPTRRRSSPPAAPHWTLTG
jgi:hypothetical protein